MLAPRRGVTILAFRNTYTVLIYTSFVITLLYVGKQMGFCQTQFSISKDNSKIFTIITCLHKTTLPTLLVLHRYNSRSTPKTIQHYYYLRASEQESGSFNLSMGNTIYSKIPQT